MPKVFFPTRSPSLVLLFFSVSPIGTFEVCIIEKFVLKLKEKTSSPVSVLQVALALVAPNNNNFLE